MNAVRVIAVVAALVGLATYLASMAVAREYRRGNVSRTTFRIWQGASATGMVVAVGLALYVVFA